MLFYYLKNSYICRVSACGQLVFKRYNVVERNQIDYNSEFSKAKIKEQ